MSKIVRRMHVSDTCLSISSVAMCWMYNEFRPEQDMKEIKMLTANYLNNANSMFHQIKNILLFMTLSIGLARAKQFNQLRLMTQILANKNLFISFMFLTWALGQTAQNEGIASGRSEEVDPSSRSGTQDIGVKMQNQSA